MLSIKGQESAKELDLVLRRAEARDIEEITLIHMQGFIGYRSTALGSRFVARLIRWFLTYPSAFGFVTIEGGRVSGYVFGAPLGYSPALTRSTLPAAATALLVRPWLILRSEIMGAILARLGQVVGWRQHRGMPSTPDEEVPTFSLVGIGVGAEYRGKGNAGLLMEAFEAEAARRGFRRLRLSVKRNNLSAQQAYLKSGWQRSGEEVDSDLYIYVKRIDERRERPRD